MRNTPQFDNYPNVIKDLKVNQLIRQELADSN